MSKPKNKVATEVVLPASNTGSALANLTESMQLDTRVSTEDVVNIFVSKYENDLHDQRKHLQQLLKDRQSKHDADLKAVLEKLRHDNEVLLQSRIPGAAAEFTWADAPTLNDKRKFWSVGISYKVVFEGFDVVASGGYGNDKISNSTNLSVNIILPLSADTLAMIDQYNTDMQSLRDRLAENNSNMQQMERKIRQFKAELASQKLKSLGMQDLMLAPELTSIFPAISLDK